VRRRLVSFGHTRGQQARAEGRRREERSELGCLLLCVLSVVFLLLFGAAVLCFAVLCFAACELALKLTALQRARLHAQCASERTNARTNERAAHESAHEPAHDHRQLCAPPALCLLSRPLSARTTNWSAQAVPFWPHPLRPDPKKQNFSWTQLRSCSRGARWSR